MTVEIRLYSTLRRCAPGGKSPVTVELPEGATVAGVLATLAVPPEVERVILVNGAHATEATPLGDGDAVTLFPPVAGG